MACEGCAKWFPFDASKIWGVCADEDIEEEVMNCDEGTDCPAFKERPHA